MQSANQVCLLIYMELLRRDAPGRLGIHGISKMGKEISGRSERTVSYTHLTLPTTPYV